MNLFDAGEECIENIARHIQESKLMSDITLQMTDILQAYLQNSIREPMILRELREVTHRMDDSIARMQISPEQGQLMQLLVELLQAKKTIDIGVFTGYSALAVALALPKDGKVIGCDVNTEWTAIAKEFWQKAKVQAKIDLRIAPALDTLQDLLAHGEAETFDFVFIDADKANYIKYYEHALKLLKVGGIVAIDNVLWSGRVADPTYNDASTKIIRQLNVLLQKDERVSMVMLPVGDGLTLARKL